MHYDACFLEIVDPINHNRGRVVHSFDIREAVTQAVKELIEDLDAKIANAHNIITVEDSYTSTPWWIPASLRPIYAQALVAHLESLKTKISKKCL